MYTHTMKRILFAGLILVILLAMCLIASADLIPPNLLKAIHMVETSGRFGPILGDHGKALGPFQIHEEYWRDSRVTGSYSQCADYNYAVKVVTAYMNRFVPYYVRMRDYEAIARTHNGGPNGYRHQATKKYWAKVKKELTK